MTFADEDNFQKRIAMFLLVRKLLQWHHWPEVLIGILASTGAVIVSGLTQEVDHALIVDSLLHINALDEE